MQVGFVAVMVHGRWAARVGFGECDIARERCSFTVVSTSHILLDRYNATCGKSGGTSPGNIHIGDEMCPPDIVGTCNPDNSREPSFRDRYAYVQSNTNNGIIPWDVFQAGRRVALVPSSRSMKQQRSLSGDLHTKANAMRSLSTVSRSLGDATIELSVNHILTYMVSCPCRGTVVSEVDPGSRYHKSKYRVRPSRGAKTYAWEAKDARPIMTLQLR